MESEYELIIVGTGFASTFFLRQYLATAKPNARVLVVEKGQRRPHSWVLDNRRHSRLSEEKYTNNLTPKKAWGFSVMFGGGSNCWFGCTPRFMPDDFEMQSRYGVGMDWPLRYDDLEPFYCGAEELMVISGPEHSPFARSRPYPQGPHRFSNADEALSKVWPEHYFHLPVARPIKATASGRPACCNNGVCNACPIDSKFTIQRDFAQLYDDPRVTLILGEAVHRVEFRGDVATGIEYGAGKRACGDFVALGANAIFNPFILLASGLEHPALGRYLNEQRGVMISFDTKGITDFQGSTVQTAHGYMFYSGEHRRQHSGILLEHSNAPYLRLEPGRWRERMRFKFILEDLPRKENVVRFNPKTPEKPEIRFDGYSAYSERALKELPRFAEKLVEKLPVERISDPIGANWTESHIQGTARMGSDAATSVVDRHSLHHTYRNLAVLGGSSFPMSSPANPTLTIAALTLLSGRHLFGSRR